MIKIIIKSFLILLLLSIFLKAQQQQVVDTTLSSNEITFEMQKSPWGAVGRSALLPGLGQFYNEDDWHVP
ncbi:MAG: hypothetical protein IH795_09920, partial [Bacteroidetes bacterium]|nr:hypothetical protein [Bacteroidota bacterium]